VYLDDRADLAAGLHERGRSGGGQLLVERDVFPPEDDIVGGVRLAVRPLHALAELEAELGGVLVGLVRFDDVGEHFVPLAVPGAWVRVADRAVERGGVLPADQAAVPVAAVLADLLDWLEDERGLRQPLIERRQLAVFDELGELRRLDVLAGRGGRALGCGSRLGGGRRRSLR